VVGVGWCCCGGGGGAGGGGGGGGPCGETVRVDITLRAAGNLLQCHNPEDHTVYSQVTIIFQNLLRDLSL
jgi:hypothetical protein